MTPLLGFWPEVLRSRVWGDDHIGSRNGYFEGIPQYGPLQNALCLSQIWPKWPFMAQNGLNPWIWEVDIPLFDPFSGGLNHPLTELIHSSWIQGIFGFTTQHNLTEVVWGVPPEDPI